MNLDPNISFKKYGLDFLFNNPDKRTSKKILNKSYLHRRDVTELIDRMKSDSKVTLVKLNNGLLEAKLDGDGQDLQTPTKTTAFWWRRLVFFFSDPGKTNAKIQKLLDAFTVLEQDLVAITATKALENSILALNSDIESKENILAPLQKAANDMTVNLAIAQGEVERLTLEIENDCLARDTIPFDSRELEKLKDMLYWNDEDKAKLSALEKKIRLPLKSSDDCAKGMAKLKLDEKVIVARIASNNTALINSEKEVGDLTIELSAHQALMAPIASYIAQLEKKLKELQSPAQTSTPAEVEEKEESSAAEKVEHQEPTRLEGLLKQSSINFDYYQIESTQDVENNPLLDNKLLWTSISLKDEFYQKTLCPLLKLGCNLLTSDKAAVTALYSKWESGLTNLGQLWANAGSANQDIDHLISKDLLKIFQTLNRFSSMFNVIVQMPVNAKELLQNLSKLDIPNTFDVHLKLSEKEAFELLETYMNKPEETDISPLFEAGSKFQSWPKDCQFFLAILLMKFELSTKEIETDPVKRGEMAANLNQAVKFSLPSFASNIATAARSSSFLFNQSLKLITSLIPSPKPETTRLEDYRKSFFIPDTFQPYFQEAIDFSKEKKRMDFDSSLRDFTTKLYTDVVKGILSKHTTDSKNIGKNGKELNLQALVVDGMDQMNIQMDLFKANKEYLEALNNPNITSATLNEKKVVDEQVKAKSLLQALKYMQTLSSIPLQNPNFLSILDALDQTILPALRKRKPLDVAKDPFLPWLQTSILKPLNDIL